MLKITTLVFVFLVGCGPAGSPTPTATAAPFAILTEGRLEAAPGEAEAVLTVTREGWEALLRARQNTDQRPVALAMSTGELLSTAPGTRVRLVRVEEGAAQVELLDGPLAGRRGWTWPHSIVP